MRLPFDFLDQRPIVVALAGSNGAGKSTFYESYLAEGGLRFINADELSASLNVSAYEAAELAASIRRELVNQRESFIFKTVLSDPVGEKVDQLASYAASMVTHNIEYETAAWPLVTTLRSSHEGLPNTIRRWDRRDPGDRARGSTA